MKLVSPEDVIYYQPQFAKLQISEIKVTTELLGYHVNALTKSGHVLGSGCAPDRSLSVAVALSETVERSLYEQISKRGEEGFLIHEFPSSCGFSVGIDEQATVQRAQNEAIERWAWSQWIDKGYILPELAVSTLKISKLAQFFQSHFDRVLFFGKTIKLNLPYSQDLFFGVVICQNGAGIFPGSKVCSTKEAPWEHALIEAWRHKLIYDNGALFPSKGNLVNGRIDFFGGNGASALAQISQSNSHEWPSPEFLLLKQLYPQPKPFFLYRALCKDYLGWHKGNHTRFVY